jgi:uncharacterized membrane protein (Fun14 family)
MISRTSAAFVAPVCGVRRRSAVRRSGPVAPAFATALAMADASSARVQQSMAGALGGQVSVGSIAGFAVGYGSKRIGQLLLVLLGCEIVALQLMAKRGWVDVRWNKIARDVSPDVDREGLDRVMETVKFKIPFAGAFSAGLYAGLRWS